MSAGRDGAETALTPDERAAMRAFLQRSEVRLGTVHRIATALLSGAGVLVLVPALGRDGIVNVMRALLDAQGTVMHRVIALMVAVTLALVLVVVWMLLVEITRFYFHANHLDTDRGTVFAPRFTLTGLRLPTDEAGGPSTTALASSRDLPTHTELLVPTNDRARAGIDRRIAAHGLGRDGEPRTDLDRAAALMALVGARDRDLVDEVAKVEFGMARHVLRVQVIVLRYIKALLVVLLTIVLMFVLAAVVDASPGLETGDERWMVAALMVWAPAVLFATGAPVRWIDRMLRSEGATTSGVRRDRELTGLERITARVASVVTVLGLGCAVALVTQDATTEGAVVFPAVIVAAVVAHVVFTVRAWRT